ncbi:hypothetical protein [Alsobacter sp. R-9]
MALERSRIGRWLRTLAAVAFAYVLVLQFALAPLGVVKAEAMPGDPAMVLCVEGHGAGGDNGVPPPGHDCTDCCLQRVVTEPALFPPVSVPVPIAEPPRAEASLRAIEDDAAPSREAWSPQRAQRGPPARG